jgi:hypothetical protein
MGFCRPEVLDAFRCTVELALSGGVARHYGEAADGTLVEPVAGEAAMKLVEVAWICAV